MVICSQVETRRLNKLLGKLIVRWGVLCLLWYSTCWINLCVRIHGYFWSSVNIIQRTYYSICSIPDAEHSKQRAPQTSLHSHQRYQVPLIISSSNPKDLGTHDPKVKSTFPPDNSSTNPRSDISAHQLIHEPASSS